MSDVKRRDFLRGGVAGLAVATGLAPLGEGKKAEAMNPNEQRVHTNLSLAYMRSGDKETAEHHGLQAKLSGWRGNMEAPGGDLEEDALKMAEPKPENIKLPTKFPDQPWKKKKD